MSTQRIPHLVFDDFLGPARVAELLAFAISRESEFAPARTANPDLRDADKPYRNCLQLANIDPVRKDFASAIDAVLERGLSLLSGRPFAPCRREIEIVWSGDGNFYRRHKDTATQNPNWNSVRALTGVYYFHRAPRAFEGGALRLYSILPVDAPAFVDIEPRCDRLVLFPAFFLHEALEVRAPGGTFEGGRFSINCWIHRERAPPPAAAAAPTI
jgi:SM-20-related protein